MRNDQLTEYLKTEIYKVFHNRYFVISIISLMIFIMIHMVKYIVPYYGSVFAEYPETVFNHWIGLQITAVSNAYYTVVIGFSALPVGMMYISELRSGYWNQLIMRCTRLRIAVSKLIAYSLCAFLLSTLPLIADYMAASVLLPSIRPIPATMYYSVWGGSLMANLFYTHPTVYLLTYIILDGIMATSFSLMVIPAAHFMNNIYAAASFPIVLFIVLKIVFGFLKLYQYIPINIMYPAVSGEMTIVNVLVEAGILMMTGISFLFCEVICYET